MGCINIGQICANSPGWLPEDFSCPVPTVVRHAPQIIGMELRFLSSIVRGLFLIGFDRSRRRVFHRSRVAVGGGGCVHIVDEAESSYLMLEILLLQRRRRRHSLSAARCFAGGG